MPEIQSIEYSQDYFIEIEKKLRKKLTEKRYRHTLGVANTAANMAMVHGEDVSRAYLAGLLHDNAKCIDSDFVDCFGNNLGRPISKWCLQAARCSSSSFPGSITIRGYRYSRRLSWRKIWFL